MTTPPIIRRAAMLSAVVVVTLAGAGCAGPAYYSDSGYAYPQPGYYPQQVERVEYGVVERIDLFRDGTSPSGVGAVVGGVAGGVLGHQIGSGRGNTAATIAGAIGGALVGNQIERSNARDRYQIVVRLDSGAILTLGDVGEGELRPGDRVRIVNNRAYRA
ncbi:MAG: glycine zipper 2TM domain-containing protein [Betaproteobacteria bacterium]